MRSFPGDAPLSLPIEWDGSSLQMRWLLTLRDIQYENHVLFRLAHEGTPWRAAAGTSVFVGGGTLLLNVQMGAPGASMVGGTPGLRIDWETAPSKVVFLIRYVEHLNQWEAVLEDLYIPSENRSAAPWLLLV